MPSPSLYLVLSIFNCLVLSFKWIIFGIQHLLIQIVPCNTIMLWHSSLLPPILQAGVYVDMAKTPGNISLGTLMSTLDILTSNTDSDLPPISTFLPIPVSSSNTPVVSTLNVSNTQNLAGTSSSLNISKFKFKLFIQSASP